MCRSVSFLDKVNLANKYKKYTFCHTHTHTKSCAQFAKVYTLLRINSQNFYITLFALLLFSYTPYKKRIVCAGVDFELF